MIVGVERRKKSGCGDMSVCGVTTSSSRSKCSRRTNVPRQSHDMSNVHKTAIVLCCPLKAEPGIISWHLRISDLYAD